MAPVKFDIYQEYDEKRARVTSGLRLQPLGLTFPGQYLVEFALVLVAYSLGVRSGWPFRSQVEMYLPCGRLLGSRWSPCLWSAIVSGQPLRSVLFS